MIILIISFTVLISYLAFNNPTLFEKLTFYPYKINHNKEWIRWVGHGFIHADYMHLIVNMLTLYFFMDALSVVFEHIAGPYYIVYGVLFYLSAIVCSSVFAYFKHKEDWNYRAIGASGAVSAFLFSFIVFAPTESIYLYFAIKMPAWLFGILYLAYEYYMGKKQNDSIGHDAHFFGAVYGVIFTIISYPDLLLRWFN